MHCHVLPCNRAKDLRGHQLIPRALKLYRTYKELRLSTSNRGAPYFVDDPLSVSVSHSAKIGVVTFSTGVQLGCDFERHQNRRFIEISRAYFHPTESAHIAREQNPEQLFYKLWTLKEAYGKAHKIGLTKGLFEDFSTIKNTPMIMVLGIKIGHLRLGRTSKGLLKMLTNLSRIKFQRKNK